MLLSLTIVLSLAAIAVLMIVAVQTFRHGWASNGYMHGDGESFFSDFGSNNSRCFDTSDCREKDGGSVDRVDARVLQKPNAARSEERMKLSP